MSAGVLLSGTSLVSAQTYYSHGDPSAQEQYLLELVNRARSNPDAEGDFLAALPYNNQDCKEVYQIHPGDLGRMNADFHAMPTRPPMGFNAALLVSSHSHNDDMTRTGVFSFRGSDGSTLNDRVVAAGYPSTLAAGNISGGEYTIVGTHFSLNTDFGQAGMGHRHNLMNDDTWYVFREAGFAVGNLVARPNGAYVTEDFGNAGTTLAVGVAYRDNDNDNFYTVGEGLVGMVVTSPDSSRITVTTASGGYALPLDRLPDYATGPQSVTLVFADQSGHPVSRQTVGLSGSTQGGGVGHAYDNVKVDLIFNADGSLRSPNVPPSDPEVVSVVGNPARGGFVVSRTGGALDLPVTVFFHHGGSAVQGQDYLPLPSSLFIPAGQSEAVISVQVSPGSNRAKKIKVFLDPNPEAPYGIGKAQSKLFLSDLP